MLHELLLNVSGHSSTPGSADHQGHARDYRSEITSPEEALVARISHLGSLQQKVSSRVGEICSTHHSLICRAVASNILYTHLASYHNHVLEIERRVLDNDALLVGPYNITPLSTVLTSLNGWFRKLDLLEDLIVHIQPNAISSHSATEGHTKAAQIIDWLRKRSYTGYPEVQSLALDLVRTAESSWLRQVSAWILYGRLPPLQYRDDFFIHEVKIQDSKSSQFAIKRELCPEFLTLSTAESILFIGRSLNYIREQVHDTSRYDHRVHSQTSDSSSRPKDNKDLSNLKTPISSVSLSCAVAEIRSSLAETSLQKLLPSIEISKTLNLFRDVSLLKDPELAHGLMVAADEYLSRRHNTSSSSINRPDNHRLQGVLIKEGELGTILRRALNLTNYGHEMEREKSLEAVRLCIKKPGGLPGRDYNEPGLANSLPTTFDDALLGTPTELSLQLEPRMSLVFDQDVLEVYSSLSSYLLGIRAAHLRLTGLWRLNALRRRRTSTRSTPSDKASSKYSARDDGLRRTWATLALAASFLTELDNYIQSEVIDGAWTTFRRWLDASPRDSQSQEMTVSLHRDPESISKRHKRLLETLTERTFLSDREFTKELRDLITQLDSAVSLLRRLGPITSSLSEEEKGNPSPTQGRLVLERDEETLCALIEKTRSVISDCLKALSSRLRELDTVLGSGQGVGDVDDECGYLDLSKGVGINGLLVKLDLNGES